MAGGGKPHPKPPQDPLSGNLTMYPTSGRTIGQCLPKVLNMPRYVVNPMKVNHTIQYIMETYKTHITTCKIKRLLYDHFYQSC